MVDHIDDFREQLNEEQLLMVYFAVPAKDALNAKFMTTAEVSEKLINYGSIRQPMPIRNLAALLQKAVFQSVRKTHARTRGWLVYERTSDKIKLERKDLAGFQHPNNL